MNHNLPGFLMHVRQMARYALPARLPKYIPVCVSICLAICIFLCPSASVTARADTAWPEKEPILADSGILIDAGSGAILYGKNIHEAYYPASITKILTALIIIENCDLDETVTFSSNAVNSLEYNSTILGARAGDRLSVRDCLYALLLQSANEVANALAEHYSGSIEAFAEVMNRKARELGCVDSHFANPSGLNDENHYTSSYDMALIARAAFENPTFEEIDSTSYYDVLPGQLKQYPDGWRYYTHHRMMRKNDSYYYDGVVGGKTGYTMLAGNTLVTCAERGGTRLIAVVLNGHQTHYEDTKALLDFGFSQFKSIPVTDLDSSYKIIEDDLTVSGIFSGTATRLVINEGSVITLPANGSFTDVSSELVYDLGEASPADAIARIDYAYGGRKVGEAYLKAEAVNGYIPGFTEQLLPSDSAGSVSTIAAGNGDSDGSGLPPDDSPQPDTKPEKIDMAEAFFNTLLYIVTAVVVIGVIAALVFGFLIYRDYRNQKERLRRRERRDERLKEWGESAPELDLAVEKDLREKRGRQEKRRARKGSGGKSL